MKPHKTMTRRSFVLLSAAMVAVLGVGCLSVLGASDGSRTLTVLTVNDRHSNYLSHPYNPANPTALDRKALGGEARLATVIDQTAHHKRMSWFLMPAIFATRLRLSPLRTVR